MAVIGVIVLLSASVLITVESVNPVPLCALYTQEAETLHCVCNAPPNINVDSTFSLRWLERNTSSNVLDIPKVRRTDNGTQYTCQMVLGGVATISVYTVQVIYGPDNSTTNITGPTPFPTDGTNPVTLTCIATEVNPTPKYTWSGINCSNGNQGNICTFSPAFPADDRKVVTCKAENPVTALPVTKTAWATFTLSLQEVTITTTTRSAPITTPAPTTAAPTAVPPTTAPPTTRALAATTPVTTTSAAPVTTVLPATTARITTTASLTTASVTSVPITTDAPVTSGLITTTAQVTTAQVTTDASVATTTAGQGTITEETDGSTPGTANTHATPPSGTGSSSTEGAAQAQKSKLPIGVIVGCSVGGFVLILVVFAICCTRRKSKKKHVTLKNAESKKGKDPIP